MEGGVISIARGEATAAKTLRQQKKRKANANNPLLGFLAAWIPPWDRLRSWRTGGKTNGKKMTTSVQNARITG